MLSKNDKIATIVIIAVAVIAFILFVFVFPGCSNPARVSNPTAVYSEISPAEYDAAENKFAGAAHVTAIEFWNDERCQALLDKRDAFKWIATFAGGLGGIGGLSTAFPDDSQKAWRYGLGISSIVLAATSASFGGLAASKTKTFETYCNTAPDPVELNLMPIPVEPIDAGAE
jgi:hypothetical protein